MGVPDDRVHVHALVSVAVLTDDGVVRIDKDWLLHRRALSRAFRHRVLATLAKAHAEGLLDTGRWSWATWRQKAHRHDGHVQVEPPRGRHREDGVRYLARYVCGVANSDSRLLDVTASTVVIATRDGQRLRLPKMEFVRRWSLHVLPTGFRKIRPAGVYAPAAGALRDRARASLPTPPPRPSPPRSKAAPSASPATVDVPRRGYPSCGGPVVHAAIERLQRVLQEITRSANLARGPPVEVSDAA